MNRQFRTGLYSNVTELSVHYFSTVPYQFLLLLFRRQNAFRVTFKGDGSRNDPYLVYHILPLEISWLRIWL